ncbi:MAG: hypothetical protein KTR21_16855 [Rhodobacteraceae bacterium]|nr:hypothetical protein [Paracoccaceae bacterium]
MEALNAAAQALLRTLEFVFGLVQLVATFLPRTLQRLVGRISNEPIYLENLEKLTRLRHPSRDEAIRVTILSRQGDVLGEQDYTSRKEAFAIAQRAFKSSKIQCIDTSYERSTKLLLCPTSPVWVPTIKIPLITRGKIRMEIVSKQ